LYTDEDLRHRLTYVETSRGCPFQCEYCLSSLDRQANGTVNVSNITVDRKDLSMDAGALGTGTDLSANATLSAATATNAGNTATLTLDADADVSADAFSLTVGGATLTFAAGSITGDQDAAATAIGAAVNALGLVGVTASVATNVVTFTSTRAFEGVDLTALKNGAAPGVTLSAATVAERAETLTFSASAAVSEGDGYQVTVGSTAYTYVAGKGESFEDVARGLKAAVDGGNVTDLSTKVEQNASGQWVLKIDNDSATSVALAGPASRRLSAPQSVPSGVRGPASPLAGVSLSTRA
jgi:flagellin